MEKHVSIARALKEKSRLVGRINILTDVINQIDAYQRRANALQDELDDFNASHFVDIDIPA